MTVQELRDLLEGMDDDLEVRMAIQPSYPLEFGVQGVALHSEFRRAEDDDDDPDDFEECVYIVQGEHIGYGHRGAWEAC